MDMKTKGIHLLSTGFEYDRIMMPLFGDYPVEKLIILKGLSSYPKAHELADHYIDKIKENFPKEIEIVELDIYDFDEVFQTVHKLLIKYSKEKKPIYLNISAAPKLALIAIISAVYMVGNKNTEVFYVKPKEYVIPQLLEELDKIKFDKKSNSLDKLKELYGKIRTNGTAVGVSGYEVIPLFPIEAINELDKLILEVLENNQGVKSIKKLTEKINEKEKIRRTTIQYRLNKLENKGLIKSIKKDRRSEIEITKIGKIYLENFFS